jgi:hypothetical protein
MSAPVIITAGDRHALICAALLKRVLADSNLKPGDRLDFLEKLDSLEGREISREMLVAIEPASDGECAIVAEAEALDSHANRGNASFRVLTSNEVFAMFKSLRRAIELRAPGGFL